MGWLAKKLIKKQAFLESIRWKGQIYCRDCGRSLIRMPLSLERWDNVHFDEMTGRKLEAWEWLPKEGLMTCPQADTPQYHVLMNLRVPGRHSVYYTDAPVIKPEVST